MEKAIEIVTKRIQTLNLLGVISGDPNNYWRLQEAEKILSLLKSGIIVNEEVKNAET